MVLLTIRIVLKMLTNRKGGSYVRNHNWIGDCLFPVLAWIQMYRIYAGRMYSVICENSNSFVAVRFGCSSVYNNIADTDREEMLHRRV